MTEYPENLHYTKTHEWARLENDNIITVGITDHAQCQLGDLVFVELPKLHRQVNVGEEVAVVESVKTAADLYSPIAGEIIEINQELSNSPEQVNKDPYGHGWIFRMKLKDKEQLEKLLSAKEYRETVGED